MIQETSLIIINVENSVLLHIFVDILWIYIFVSNSLMNRKFKKEPHLFEIIFGYTLFWLSTLDILLTISNSVIVVICNYMSTNSQSRLLG